MQIRQFSKTYSLTAGVLRKSNPHTFAKLEFQLHKGSAPLTSHQAYISAQSGVSSFLLAP
jgi:hypothetical protein